jgi:hypothetical protein
MSLHTDKDPDRVERTNVSRQAFDAADVGRFKSEVLAERLSRRFGGQVSYSVLPYGARLLNVGAVDNAPARRAVASTLEERVPYAARKNRPAPILWLDAGNARNSGRCYSATRYLPTNSTAHSTPPTKRASRSQRPVCSARTSWSRHRNQFCARGATVRWPSPKAIRGRTSTR